MKVRISINGIRHEKYFKSKCDADCWIKDMILKYSDKSLDGEIWKEIPWFSNYQASNYGRIRSNNYKKSGLVKVLSPAASKDGYLKTSLLTDDNKYKSWTVHKYVTMAFYGLIPDGMEVNHKDGNKKNNNISNLEYCTRSYNMKHAINNGLQRPKIGELNGMAKLTNEQVIESRMAKKENGRYWGRNDMAKRFNISPKHLQRIVNNPDKTWMNI